MKQTHPYVTTGLLNGGFLCVLIAWHEQVYQKTVLFDWGTLMLLAGALWGLAAGVALWNNCSRILQFDVQRPPWYYYLLATPLCIYAGLTPWLLLVALNSMPTSVALFLPS